MMFDLMRESDLPLRDRTFVDNEPVKLSICCITFNHANFVAQCLDGFLDQRCNFRVEIVIYDDASTDQTAAIISEYAARHPTIFRTMLMLDNQFSKGVNPYFGYVFPVAMGDYIAVCDGDDFWADPTKLSRQVRILDTEPDIALTFGRVRGVDENGKDTPYRGGVERDLSPKQLKAAPPINTLTSCFRNIFRDGPVSLFVRTSTIGDLTVWGMLGYHGGARFLPELLPANYRLRVGGLISMQGRERQITMTAITHLHLAAFHLEKGDTHATLAAIKEMIAHFNEVGQGSLNYRSVWNEPISRRFKRWRRAVKRRLRGR